MTQKLMGDYDKALANYDAGTKALTRSFVKSMHNRDTNPIYAHEDVPGERWVDCATFGALYSASENSEIASVAFPTGESAEEELRSRSHGGLFFFEEKIPRVGIVRVFLPNYFNSFREWLRHEGSFAHLVGNQGTIFSLQGRTEEAQACFVEADYFAQTAK